MKKILMSFAMLVFVGVIVVASTGAFFSDIEISTGNVFAAGEIDLLIDNEQHYNGMVCADTNSSPDVADYRWVEESTGSSTYPELIGLPCTGSWNIKNLVGENFFDFQDVKPGDNGENTVSLHVETNEAWACMSVTDLVESDNDVTEPEALDDLDGDLSGELGEAIEFFVWRDDGDNIYENGEEALTDGAVNFDGLGDQVWAIADSTTGDGMSPLAPGSSSYVGMAWCLGEMEINGSDISCDGDNLDNATQTDSMAFSIAFDVVQSRNNLNYVCSLEDNGEGEEIEAQGPNDGWHGGGDLLWQVEARFGNNDLSGDWEFGVGTNTQSANQDNSNYIWQTGVAVPFSVAYDGTTATFNIDGNPVSYVVGTTTNTAVLNIVAGKVSSGVGDSVELTNLMLNGLPVNPNSLIDTDNTNALYLLINSIDLSSGFNLTGMVEFNWTNGTTAGSRPDFQVQIRD